MGFTRGGNIKENIGVGLESKVKKLNGLIIRESDISKKLVNPWDSISPGPFKKEWFNKEMPYYYDLDIIVLIIKDQFKFIRNQLDHKDYKGYLSELFDILSDLEKIEKSEFTFPTAKNVAAKTIAQDLPMSAPSGLIPVFDQYYTRKNKKDDIQKK